MSGRIGTLLPPPLIYLCFIQLAWGLGDLLPLPLPDNRPTRLAGWSLIALGLALAGWTVWQMLRQRTTLNPYGTPARLLQEGPFRLSRNPVYLADTLIYSGIGLLLASLWPCLLLPLLILCMNRAVIQHEEQLLKGLFGNDYQAYARRVRRWI